MKQESVVHTSGPFEGLIPGAHVVVIYHGAPAAYMTVTRVKQHAIEGVDGGSNCRVTIVSPTELRFYADLGPNRQSILRDVKIRVMPRTEV